MVCRISRVYIWNLQNLWPSSAQQKKQATTQKNPAVQLPRWSGMNELYKLWFQPIKFFELVMLVPLHLELQSHPHRTHPRPAAGSTSRKQEKSQLQRVVPCNPVFFAKPLSRWAELVESQEELGAWLSCSFDDEVFNEDSQRTLRIHFCDSAIVVKWGRHWHSVKQQSS